MHGVGPHGGSMHRLACMGWACMGWAWIVWACLHSLGLHRVGLHRLGLKVIITSHSLTVLYIATHWYIIHKTWWYVKESNLFSLDVYSNKQYLTFFFLSVLFWCPRLKYHFVLFFIHREGCSNIYLHCFSFAMNCYVMIKISIANIMFSFTQISQTSV